MEPTPLKKANFQQLNVAPTLQMEHHIKLFQLKGFYRQEPSMLLTKACNDGAQWLKPMTLLL